MSGLDDIFARHSQYQDSMLAAFEQHLREITMSAQARAIVALQSKLAITDGVIDMTPGNYKVLRGLGKLLSQEMVRSGYRRLVQAFVAEFGNTIHFLDETLAFLSSQMQTPLPLERLNRQDQVLGTFQITTVDALEDAVQSAAGAAMQRTMFSVGGLQFGDLVKTITDRLSVSIARARTVADTAMSTFYRTATDRAFTIIENKAGGGTPQKYWYAGPVDKLERPFCRHLTSVDKVYTREQIDAMDNLQLPNVFITGGGWNCRHSWLLSTADLEARAGRAA